MGFGLMMQGMLAAWLPLPWFASESHGSHGYSQWNWLGRGRLNVLQPNQPVLPHAVPCQ